MCCINLYCFFTIFTWRVQGMPTSSKHSPAFCNSQYSNYYSNSNTPWTPGEPSKVPLGTSTTTSAIKIGGVTIFFWPLARPPPSNPWFRILIPPPPWSLYTNSYNHLKSLQTCLFYLLGLLCTMKVRIETFPLYLKDIRRTNLLACWKWCIQHMFI